MPLLVPRLISLCLMIVGGLECSGDEIGGVLSSVEDAEAKCELALEMARQKLIEAYKQEIVRQTESGMLENVTRLATGLQHFESDGLLLDPELADRYKEFGKSSKSARDSLLDAYRVASGSLAALGAVDKLQEIQQRIRDRGLISKLVSLQVTSRPSLHLLHGDFKCVVKDVERHERINATYEMVIGVSTDGILRESVADAGIQGRPSEIVSFRSVNIPNHYLAHGNNELLLQRYSEDDVFRLNASFRVQKGLYRSSGVSFEAVNYPDHYLTVTAGGAVRLGKRQPTAEYARSATFSIDRPKFPIW